MELAKAKFKLRDNEVPGIPPSNAPTAPPPPPETSAPASTLKNGPMHGPGQAAAPVLASPLLAPRSRPEDSKTFRIGVKIFFIGGIVGTVAFLFLGYRFVKNRYFNEPAAVTTAAPAAAKVPKKDAPAPAPDAKPAAKKAMAAQIPEVPYIEEYVQRLKISGLAQGSRPRALIDGTLYTPGQVLEPKEGIILEGIDFEKKRLIFKDAAGRRASAKF